MSTPPSTAPWASPKHPDIQLTPISPEAMEALSRGDAPAAGLPGTFAGDELEGLWRIRHRQLEETPEHASWITRLILHIPTSQPVGVAGFHAPPDENGMVEVGYWIDPVHRRQGHAAGSLDILLAVASSHPQVTTVRATISPDNAPSLHMTRDRGFTEVGEQWDEEDGLEIIHELDVR